MQPQLSVVMPARNAAPWIEEALDSVLGQAVEAMEVIVLDNGSTDATAELVRALADQDARVRLVRSQATSAAAARNEGVDLSTGEYLVFADSDDIVPDGAYDALLASLDASGADLAIGDHLKFSPSDTWSPTKRWHDFTDHQTARLPSDVPGLLAGRACWNRVFRRSFWDREGLRFPILESLEDMEPMTRAFVSARTIDVVPRAVYLYRDRADGSSVSGASDVAATVRYLEQEVACAALVRHDDVLRSQHARVVLDADGWVHLARFLGSSPDAGALDEVRRALAPLLEAVPIEVLPEVAPTRRMLWALVLDGHLDTAASFAAQTGGAEPGRAAIAWAAAVAALRVGGDRRGLLAALQADGLYTALVNGADALSAAEIAELLDVLGDLPRVDVEEGLRSSMQQALLAGDAAAIAGVSRTRHLVPLVVAAAEGTAEGLELCGQLGVETDVSVRLVLSSGTEQREVEVALDGRGWRASVTAGDLAPGRWAVAVRVAPAGALLPVVTARMPLPRLDDHFPIQPLADRRDGWRFLIDRRPPSARGVAGLAARLRARVRRGGR